MDSSLRKFLGSKDLVILTQDQEKSLTAQAQAGDREALDQLIRSQAHWIYRICGDIQKPRGISTEDLFTDLVWECARAIKHKYNPEKSRLSNFLNTVVRFRARDYIRKNASSFGCLPRKPNATDLVDSHEENIKQLIAQPIESDVVQDDYRQDVKELHDVVTSIINLLDRRSRFILRLRANGKTFQQIAEADTSRNIRLGISGRITKVQHIKEILFRVRSKVMQEILRRDISCESIISESNLPSVYNDLLELGR